jgi:thiol-disulfide isomerase/thioredoxin
VVPRPGPSTARKRADPQSLNLREPPSPGVALLVENPTPEEFDALVRDHDVLFVDFSASWCAPCRAYTPKFHRAAREMRRAFPDGSYVFVTVDVDLVQDLARRFSVRSVPTTVVVREKRGLFRTKKDEVERFSGDKPWNDLVRAFTDVLERAGGRPEG